MLFPPDSIYDLNSLAVITIQIPMYGMTGTVYLSGPTTVWCSDPMELKSSLGRTIETELLSMNLQGSSQIFPLVQVELNTETPSAGQAIDMNPDPNKDFPAESFFDVFVQVTVMMPDSSVMVLHNVDPVHLNAEIHCVPPPGSPFQNKVPTPLLTPTGYPVAYLTQVSHKLENPIFSVMPFANLHNASMGPLEFPNRTFWGGAIAEPDLPGIGWPPIGRIFPTLLGIDEYLDNLDALSFGTDDVTYESVNFTTITFSVDPLTMGIPGTSVNFEFATGTSYNATDTPDPPEQEADIFYTPLDGTNTHFFDEKDPSCINFNMTVTNFWATPTSCWQPYNPPPPPGWPGGEFPEDTDALEMNNIFYVGMDTTYDRLIDELINNVFFSLDATSGSIGQQPPNFRPGPPDFTSADDILMSPPPGNTYGIYASGTVDIGLQPGDDLDALCLLDLGQPGFLDPGIDLALFSLATGSPTLTTLPASAADIFFTDFTGMFFPYITAVNLGLILEDDLDAMDCQYMVDTTEYIDFGDAPDQ